MVVTARPLFVGEDCGRALRARSADAAQCYNHCRLNWEAFIDKRYIRTNDRIRAREIRVIDEDSQQLGIMPPFEALKIARGKNLDLVEISPTADPPVCKIIDYNKFLYDKKKKEKEMKAKSKVSEVKEIRFTPNTDDHDFDFKAKHAESFLKEGNKVKAYVQFKGRAIQFQDRGQLLLLKFADRLKEVGILENLPKLEGRRMLALFAPKGKKK